MIHLLEIGPEITEKQLSKLSRRYAMTGGYELCLAEKLTSEDLGLIIERFIPPLEAYERSEARYRSSNAYRILNLVFNHPELTEEQRQTLSSLIILDEGQSY